MKNSPFKLVTFDLFNEIIPIPSQDFCIYVWWSPEELKSIKNELLKTIEIKNYCKNLSNYFTSNKNNVNILYEEQRM